MLSFIKFVALITLFLFIFTPSRWATGEPNYAERPNIYQTMDNGAFQDFPNCRRLNDPSLNGEHFFNTVLVKTFDGTVRKMSFSKAWDRAQYGNTDRWPEQVWVIGVCGNGESL